MVIVYYQIVHIKKRILKMKRKREKNMDETDDVMFMLGKINDKLKKLVDEMSFGIPMEKQTAKMSYNMTIEMMRELKELEEAFLLLRNKNHIFYAGKIVGRIEGSQYVILKGIKNYQDMENNNAKNI